MLLCSLLTHGSGLLALPPTHQAFSCLRVSEPDTLVSSPYHSWFKCHLPSHFTNQFLLHCHLLSRWVPCFMPTISPLSTLLISVVFHCLTNYSILTHSISLPTMTGAFAMCISSAQHILEPTNRTVKKYWTGLGLQVCDVSSQREAVLYLIF